MSAIIPSGLWVNDPYASTNVRVVRDYFKGDTNPIVDSAQLRASGTQTYNALSPEPGVSSAGNALTTFFNDWYFRVHINPSSLVLGNLLSSQNRVVRLWNAFLSTRSLDDVAYPPTPGFNVTEPVATPYTLRPLEQLSYTFAIGLDGPPTINVTVSFIINGATFVVPVTGSRVVVWPFAPNWSSPVNDTLDYRTTIQRSQNGTDVRYPLRDKPRRSIEYQGLVRRADAARMQQLLLGWQARLFAVPLWQDKVSLTTPLAPGATSATVDVDPRIRSFEAGSTVVIFGGSTSFETVELSAVTATTLTFSRPIEGTWAAGTAVLAVAIAGMEGQPGVQYLTDGVVVFQCRWLGLPGRTPVNADKASAAPATYRNTELFDWQPNWAAGSAQSWSQDARYVDNTVGRFVLDYQSAVPQIITRQRWMGKGATEIKALRDFFARRQGRARPFWRSTRTDDFRLVQAAASGATAITCEDNGYSLLNSANQLRRDIEIVLRNGTVIRRRITASSVVSGNLQLTLDSAVGVNIAPADIRRISLLELTCMAGDGLTFSYDHRGVAQLDVAFEPVRQD